MRDVPSPTTKRKVLGHELRHLRQRAELDITDSELLSVLDRSWSVLSKLENGITGIRQGPLRDLVTFYKEKIGTDAAGGPADGGDPIDLEEFAELNRGAENRGRWRGHRGVYSKWFRAAVDFEQDASAINIYLTELVHGLFQTEAYMQALFAPVHEPNAKTAAQVKARLERQEVLNRPDVEVTAILSESCLRRMIGSRDVMLHQMLYLAEVAMRPNVHIHVLPFATPVVPKAHSYPFVYFRIPSASPRTPPLETVLVEQFTNCDYLDGFQDLADYSGLWTGLLGAALDPAVSRDFLLRAAKDYE
ncbi:DUF5753 domain-containing protein [Actinophytocola sp.]|uniref:DUF5753 domain-containing protein n=1 Tax=Actinophytocola sp. TaxID=1872138 RepID=UPI003D6B24A4